MKTPRKMLLCVTAVSMVTVAGCKEEAQPVGTVGQPRYEPMPDVDAGPTAGPASSPTEAPPPATASVDAGVPAIPHPSPGIPPTPAPTVGTTAVAPDRR